MTGLAAGLSDDSVDVDIAQCNSLRGQQFVRDHDQRAVSQLRFRFREIGKVAADTDDHVADIVQPFFEIVILGARKELGVLAQQSVQSGLRGHPFVYNPSTDFVCECSVAENRLVDGKDRSFFVAHLRFDFTFQCAKISRRFVASCFVGGQFGCDF